MTEFERNMFSREERLIGTETLHSVAQSRVIVFGVGGVGGWCAEALVRSGIHYLTIVDSDVVVPSNLNRQVVATSATVGKVKVEALRERLLSINPDAEITAIHRAYTKETAETFGIESYDYVIDAIDSLEHKANLMLHVASSKAVLFSSMGAALRMDPTQVTVAEFWKVTGDPLARALRNRFKKMKQFPARKFRCVYSLEPARPNLTEGDGNGSAVQVVGVFGFTLASLVIRDIESNEHLRAEVD